jgi:serine phosphatase RsbU (regulator of sigma subunit)
LSGPSQSFRAAYAAALRDYVSHPDAQNLLSAEELGRLALTDGFGVLEVVELHHRVVEDLPPAGSGPPRTVQALPFLLQSLAALDVATKGFVESQTRFQAERAHSKRLQALVRTSVLILSELMVDERVRVGVDQARSVFAADGAAFQFERGGRVLVADDPRSEGTPVDLSCFAEETTGRQFSTAAPVPVHCLGIALSATGRPSGVLAVWRREAPFSAFEEALIGQYANIMASALQHAHAYEQERDVAAALQHSLLLPKVPVIPEFTLAARYLPAARQRGVGGDWYDVISLPGQRIGMVVGDVMGHGVPAAALMGQLRVALRAYALEDRSPAHVLSCVDRLFQSLPDERFVTMVYAVLESTGTLHLANAGHPPPLVVEADGSSLLCREARSLPLGVGNGATDREDFTLKLTPGSVLLLYTDGLVERRHAAIEQRLATLQAAVRGPVATLEELCDAAVAALVEPDHEDDVCLLAASLSPFSAGRPASRDLLETT